MSENTLVDFVEQEWRADFLCMCDTYFCISIF